MEIIKSLKNDLQQKKADDNMKQKQLLDQEAKSLMVIEPMKAANEEIQILEKVKEEYQKISAKLEKYKEQIQKYEADYKELEWEYEVKLQQYGYLEKEKETFDKFSQHIYEIHQKAGLKNLILEKQLETIEESIEIKEAQL